ncbi:MAG: hypothetical protein K1060chlam2_00511 [Chlamydiae bacterium]|nr:hypothetical protein [Chlamydiota bacterium]
MNCITPSSTDAIGIIYRFGKKKVPVIYRKVGIITENVSIYPSVFAHTLQIPSTDLCKKLKLRREKKWPRGESINCYAFAVGRTPYTTAKDPVPGGYHVQKIRDELKLLLRSSIKRYRPLLRHTPCEVLVDTFKQYNKTKDNQQSETAVIIGIMNSNTNAKIIGLIESFVEVYYNKNLLKFSNSHEDFEDLVKLLFTGFEIDKKKMIPKVMTGLLLLDGLKKIDFSTELKMKRDECPFGTFFIAAFSKINDDYHFCRLFQDGWYERNGANIESYKTGTGEKQKKLVGIPVGTQEEIKARFCLGRKNMEFIGYFLVPVNAQIVDTFGRTYFFESQKT